MASEEQTAALAERWASERDDRTLGALPSEEPISRLLPALKDQIRRACGPEALNLVKHSNDKRSGMITILIGVRDGARLRRKDGLECELKAILAKHDRDVAIVSYAMSLHAPDADGRPTPGFVRWEFDKHRPDGTTALHHPIAHLHPGHEHVRLPAPILTIRELVAQFCRIPAWW